MSVPPSPTASREGLAPASESVSPASNEELEFLLRSAELLHAYGTPAHRLEEALSACARRMGVRAQFFSTPTSFLAGFGEGSAQRTNLLRVQPGRIELEKLVLFDRVLDDVEAGRATITAGLDRLETIARAKSRFAGAWLVTAYGVASAGAAVLFGGGVREVVLSLALGLSCGLLSLGTQKSSRLTRVFEATASFLAAFLVVAAAHHLAPVSDRIVTLAGLIVLLPGLSLTVAMNELATRHLVSGTARLMGALTVFLIIALGVASGRRLGELAFGAVPPDPVIAALPSWTMWPGIVASTFAFLVLFQARPRDFGWILVTGCLGFEAARSGAEHLGPELSAFAGALVVGVASNLFARRSRCPATVTLVPGILLLVPGSIGYQSLAFFIARDMLAGMETAFRTTLTAIALAGGVLFANVLLPPRRAL